jgi:hypothetical protein
LNFDDVGFLIGSGNGSHNTAYFELWDDGALVLASSVAHQVSFHYLGFEGGGFDTIFLRDGPVGQSVGNGTHNALTVDAIEVSVSSVPEPGTWLLMGTGLVGLLGYGWRRRNA